MRLLAGLNFRLIDATRAQPRFLDKIPIITSASLDAQSSYPCPGSILSEVVSTWIENPSTSLTEIDTQVPWSIESRESLHLFTVLTVKLLPTE